jgi:hypothetical protein
MKAAVYLRIASVLTLVHAILHTMGGVFGKPLPGPATLAVAAMQSNQFMWLGHMRTYFGFYRGMGLAGTIFLTVDAVAFWTLASVVRQDGRRLRPVLAVFLAGYLVMAVNSYTYFFMGPVVAEILIAGCVGMAMVTAKEPLIQSSMQAAPAVQ